MSYRICDIYGRKLCIIHQDNSIAIQPNGNEQVLLVAGDPVVRFMQYAGSVYVRPGQTQTNIVFNGVTVDEYGQRTLPRFAVLVVEDSSVMINTTGLVPQLIGGEITQIRPLLQAGGRPGEENLTQALNAWREGVLADTTGLGLVGQAIHDMIIRFIGYTVVTELVPATLEKVSKVTLNYSIGETYHFPEAEFSIATRYGQGQITRYMYRLRDSNDALWTLTLEFLGVNVGYTAKLKLERTHNGTYGV